MVLTESFYQRSDVVKIARELLGKVLFTKIDGMITGGVIVETEAYSWKEKGCHAYGAKKTNRNAIMFEEGGNAYVYLCYGMYNLFNVVTNRQGVADAVLIRALEPFEGIDTMTLRRGPIKNAFQLTSGPGKLTKAMGIDRKLNGKSLLDSEVWLEDRGIKIATKSIAASPRIGIDYAGDDALLPWRFTVQGNKWISKP
ncbi:DNA-3-methyladenine glycosylase [Pseudochryseolinea flava]|uniref:Putative 3-methyladenine DNA glycosylase n=1 Tax=Pseudochryseolinea flava TaxID=2059302 RepID=A0A364Y4S1_9BACT|nr:DNA-3-methyladenine glycosylase [Pseudochryseolinea flava]RAW01188.1 DNA-3-methyladenine glycosylase [Pseudochryseolinea flava]